MSRKLKFKAKIETAVKQPTGIGPFDSEEVFLDWILTLPNPIGIVLLGANTEFRKAFKQKLRDVIKERNKDGDVQKPYNDIAIGTDTHVKQVKFPYSHADSLVTLSSVVSPDDSKRSRAIGILRTRAMVDLVLVICIQDTTLALSGKRNSARYAKDVEFRIANNLLEDPPTFTDSQIPNQIPDIIASIWV